VIPTKLLGTVLALERKEVDKIAGLLGALVADGKHLLLAFRGCGWAGHVKSRNE